MTIISDKTNIEEKCSDQARDLAGAAATFSTTLHQVLIDDYPELEALSKYSLFDTFKYFVTAASIGLAFSQIIDNTPEDLHRPLSMAIVERMIEITKEEGLLEHFSDSINYSLEQGVQIDEAIGLWVWSNIFYNKKDIENIISLPIYSKILGLHILRGFGNWWSA